MTLYRFAILSAVFFLIALLCACAGPSELLHKVPNPRTGETIEVWSMGNDAGCHDGAAGCWKGANKVYVARFDAGAEAHEVHFHGINRGQHTEPWQNIRINRIEFPCARVTFPGYNTEYKYGDVMCRFDLGEPRKAKDERERNFVALAMKEIRL